MHAGAVTEREAVALTGLTAAELREPSFVKILRARGAIPDDGVAR